MSKTCVYCNWRPGVLLEQMDDDDGGIIEVDVCYECYWDEEESER